MKMKTVVVALLLVAIIAASAIYFFILTPSKHVFEGTLIREISTTVQEVA